MYKRFIRLLLLASSVLSPWAVAATLPTAVQNCVSAMDCFVSMTPFFQSTFPAPGGNGSMAAYQMFENLSGTPKEKVLIEYGLSAPARVDNVTFSGGVPSASSTPITGSLWMNLASSYDLSESRHFLSLYFDQQSGGSGGLWGNPPSVDGELLLSMSTAGLLAGSEFSLADCCSPGSVTGGLLSHFSEADPGSGVLACVADGCETEIILNLLNVEFSSDGSTATFGINAADARNLLYESHYDFNDPDGGSTQELYYVKAVPVPPALYLLLSGLGVLGLRAKRG